MSPPASWRNAIQAPSGENTPFQLLPSLVSATSWPVAISTAWTSLPPVGRRSVYTSHSPSGENEARYGSPSAPIFCGGAARPAVGTRRMRGTPSVYEVTAIVLPSGDHATSDRFESAERMASRRGALAV